MIPELFNRLSNLITHSEGCYVLPPFALGLELHQNHAAADLVGYTLRKVSSCCRTLLYFH